MKILIAEDDRVSRTFMEKFMSAYGQCDIAVDGMEAIDLFMDALKRKEPYDLARFDTYSCDFSRLQTTCLHEVR